MLPHPVVRSHRHQSLGLGLGRCQGKPLGNALPRITLLTHLGKLCAKPRTSVVPTFGQPSSAE